jgi:hypothetical protein
MRSRPTLTAIVLGSSRVRFFILTHNGSWAVIEVVVYLLRTEYLFAVIFAQITAISDIAIACLFQNSSRILRRDLTIFPCLVVDLHKDELSGMLQN